MAVHEFCVLHKKHTLNSVDKKVARLFKRNNIGITSSKMGSRTFYYVEVMECEADGSNWIWQGKACCAKAAVAEAVDDYVKRLEWKKKESGEIMYCPRCGEQTLNRIEVCHDDGTERKSSYSCLSCKNEDIIYIHEFPTGGTG